MTDLNDRSAAELNKAKRSIDQAVEQSQLAYQFSPGSYTYSAMIACRQAAFTLTEAIPEELATGRSIITQERKG